MKNKVFFIAIFALIIIFLIGGWVIYNYYQKDNYQAIEKNIESRVVYFADFAQRKTGDNIWLDSDKAKISIRIPQGWEIFDNSSSVFSIKTKDFVPLNNDEKKIPIPSVGCWINVNIQIDELGEGYENLTQLVLSTQGYFDENTNEQKIQIGSLSALKNTSLQENGKGIFIKIPKDNITYKIDTFLFGSDKEKCEKEFDDFLGSLVIK